MTHQSVRQLENRRAARRCALRIGNAGEEKVLVGKIDRVLTAHPAEGETILRFTPDLIAIPVVPADGVVDLLGGGGGFHQFLIIDEETLQGIAEMTGGEYFRAENADQLLQIFRDLPTQIVLQKENVELSAIFSALAALIGGVAVVLSLRWHRFP